MWDRPCKSQFRFGPFIIGSRSRHSRSGRCLSVLRKRLTDLGPATPSKDLLWGSTRRTSVDTGTRSICASRLPDHPNPSSGLPDPNLGSELRPVHAGAPGRIESVRRQESEPRTPPSHLWKCTVSSRVGPWDRTGPSVDNPSIRTRTLPLVTYEVRSGTGTGSSKTVVRFPEDPTPLAPRVHR